MCDNILIWKNKLNFQYTLHTCMFRHYAHNNEDIFWMRLKVFLKRAYLLRNKERDGILKKENISFYRSLIFQIVCFVGDSISASFCLIQTRFYCLFYDFIMCNAIFYISQLQKTFCLYLHFDREILFFYPILNIIVRS